MKWRRGKRPLTISLFAACFLTVAFAGLVLALVDPETTWFVWADRLDSLGILGALPPTQEVGLVMACAMFTIALIPIVWIYVLGSTRARWIVLVFSLLKLALWFDASTFAGYSDAGEMIRSAEPLLVVAALVFLFSSSSIRWLTNKQGQDTEAFS